MSDTSQGFAVEARAEVEALASAGARVAATARAAGADERDVSILVLKWAGGQFGERLVALTSMADEVMVHLAANAVPGLAFAFLDTGYHFAETLGTRDALTAALGLNLTNVTPALTVAEQADRHGADLYARDPNACCAIRKVEPLNRVLADYAAWITGMRRVEAPTRSDIDVVEVDGKRNKVKINPLARWSDDDVAHYLRDHHVLLNPLRQIGYQSIGCEPCTRLPLPGEAARAGRWAGRDKTECGLHT